ncbi:MULTISPECIES: flagellar protein FlaG [unclassified Dehalobacter]|uniref:flagellar protein FlaG n=1 Tax=unclassified Dehalobacter TaxID=2635733 RepID=UPI000372272C|nr:MULTISPECIES: flagellar protein FlaG [unclassified Dehalobacter]RJE48775.1 flagellar biosynthesis protein FlaG [Dehalobacter sp. MCB1]TCX51867.1 flagellar biosynthesis protein FlaG [Dehalobacter sp. 14DCB1]TCX52927.1 flagellar biosynthesis protein FlaG [Dehalobacter sp. 12DCB1]
MVSAVQPTNLNPVMPQDTFSGQKLEQGKNEAPRLVVDQKDNAASAREELPREEVEQTAEKMNRLMGLFNKKLQFEVAEKSDRIVVKIIDQESGEILSEIPPAKVVEMLESVQDSVGLIVDERA